jgi:hypothetical protein
MGLQHACAQSSSHLAALLFNSCQKGVFGRQQEIDDKFQLYKMSLRCFICFFSRLIIKVCEAVKKVLARTLRTGKELTALKVCTGLGLGLVAQTVFGFGLHLNCSNQTLYRTFRASSGCYFFSEKFYW